MNIQQSIIKGIKEQLYLHSYLVLPGFGGFVLKTRPSHFSNAGGSIVPPTKTISFNAQLRQNDGVLAHWLQSELGCGPSEADQHLKDFTAFCSGILNNRRRINLETIGFFYLDFENNICFEGQSESNFMTESFGLEPVNLKAIPKETKEPQREPAFKDRIITHKPEETPLAVAVRGRKTLSRFVVPSMFAVMLLGFLALLVSNRKISGQLQATISGASAQGVYQPHVYPELVLESSKNLNEAYVADANGIAQLHLNKDHAIAVSVLPSASVESFDGKYEIVLGCFASEKNAEKLIKKLARNHLSAAISGKNEKGLFIVSKGAYSDHASALDKLLDLKNRYPSAWIRQRR